MSGSDPSQGQLAGEDARIEALRRFNRFFTHKIGVLSEGLLDSRFSLAEVRVMYELAHRDGPTAAELCEILDLDAGYMSRIVRRLLSEKLIAKRRSDSDGRAHRLSLTNKGKHVYASLDQGSRDQVATMLRELSVQDQDRVLGAMRAIEEVLGPGPEAPVPYILRPHRPGDMGWVVWRHGVLYAAEQGWDDRFEALVAGIVVQFMQNFDPRRERCWIAERDGRNIGSIFLVKDSEDVAKLRLLLVEPEARGLGLGRHLVDECIRTARQLGYQKLTLWTNDVLHAARRIYEGAGFRLVREEPHHSYGAELVGQHWELDLREEDQSRRAVNHYLVFYEVVPDYARRREALRADHLEHAWRAYRRGELVLAGAMDDPLDSAVLLFRGDSRAVAEDFAKKDPYVKHGLVTRWHVRPWKTVVGEGAARPLLPGQCVGTREPLHGG